MYGDLIGGRRIESTSVNKGAIVATLDGDDEGPTEKAYVRQSLGLRARPRAQKKVNVITSQDGDYPEVLLMWDPSLSLPDIAEGATQVHSCGSNPQMIEVTDSKIKLGKDAQQSVVRGDQYRTAEDTFFSGLANVCTAVGTALTSAGKDKALVAVAKEAAASLVTAGTSLNTVQTLLSAFNNNSKDYLSTLVKTE